MVDKFLPADSPDIDAPPVEVAMPNIGTMTFKYGKGVKLHKPVCNSCQPQWLGKADSNKATAFRLAVMHAISKHGWVPREHAPV